MDSPYCMIWVTRILRRRQHRVGCPGSRRVDSGRRHCWLGISLLTLGENPQQTLAHGDLKRPNAAMDISRSDRVGQNPWPFVAIVLGALGFSWQSPAAELTGVARIGAVPGDEFGYATVLDTERLVVAAPGESGRAGAVYIFDCNVTPCAQTARLAAPISIPNQAFGAALALSANTLAIGAPGSGSGAAQAGGTVYVYTSSAPGNWALQATLLPTSVQVGDRFGSALALLNDTLLVGAEGDAQNRGAVYAFNRSGSIWTFPTQLLAADGVANDGFGAAVALSASHALVGAPFAGDVGVGAIYAHGAAYVFDRVTPSSWSLATVLLAQTPQVGDGFGFSVALNASQALVAAPFAGLEAGRISVFDDLGVGWAASAEISSVTATAGTRLGWSLALNGATLIAGAPFQALVPGANCGSVVRFEHTTAWTEGAPLTLRSPSPGDLGGWSAAGFGLRYAVGRPGFDQASSQHQGQVAWFDFAEQLFTDAFELTDPLCQ